MLSFFGPPVCGWGRWRPSNSAATSAGERFGPPRPASTGRPASGNDASSGVSCRSGERIGPTHRTSHAPREEIRHAERDEHYGEQKYVGSVIRVPGGTFVRNSSASSANSGLISTITPSSTSTPACRSQSRCSAARASRTCSARVGLRPGLVLQAGRTPGPDRLPRRSRGGPAASGRK